MQKQKPLTQTLKKITSTLQSTRKQIQSSHPQQIPQFKQTFNQLESLIKNQSIPLQQLKMVGGVSNNQNHLGLKRIFCGHLDRIKVQIHSWLQLCQSQLTLHYNLKPTQTWQKIHSNLDKLITLWQQQQTNPQQMFQTIIKAFQIKDGIFQKVLKQLVYSKNVLWRDLNAPYDDFVHGEVKQAINQIKNLEEKLGYVPARIRFQCAKVQQIRVEGNLVGLVGIHVNDFKEIMEGLKNYSKLSGQQQVIEDISKNQYIVKGLRERIQKLTTSYDLLMQKYRNLQISKGKPTLSQQKSLTQRVQQLQSQLSKSQSQCHQSRLSITKLQTTITSLRSHNQTLEQDLLKYQKHHLPKIKELEQVQKGISQEYVKVRRDLETYGGIVLAERQEKVRLVEDLQVQRKRVKQLAYMVGRQKNKNKEKVMELGRKDKIIMELVDQKIG